MFRTCETYDFHLVDDGVAGPVRIPCRVEIASRRDMPDADPHNLVVGATTDARLSMLARALIAERIADTIDGQPFYGPILGAGPDDHAPERIAVWAYWLARDQSRHEREQGGWRLTVESARVVVGDRWSVEYAPTFGDR